MQVLEKLDGLAESDSDNVLFERIAADLQEKGFSVNAAAFSPELAGSLHRHVLAMQDAKFSKAGIGRGQDYLHNKFVRTDEICWIDGSSPAGNDWLNWTSRLQQHLNKKLFLGLFSFESHFSHYGVGDYYKRHKDAFSGEANRVLSLVLYLNPGWTPDAGGELVIYEGDEDLTGTRVVPLMGTLVLFLSEEFPHEVLPAQRDRYAVAGWYRVNGSVFDRIDPPL